MLKFNPKFCWWFVLIMLFLVGCANNQTDTSSIRKDSQTFRDTLGKGTVETNEKTIDVYTCEFEEYTSVCKPIKYSHNDNENIFDNPVSRIDTVFNDTLILLYAKSPDTDFELQVPVDTIKKHGTTVKCLEKYLEGNQEDDNWKIYIKIEYKGEVYWTNYVNTTTINEDFVPDKPKFSVKVMTFYFTPK